MQNCILLDKGNIALTQFGQVTDKVLLLLMRSLAWYMLV